MISFVTQCPRGKMMGNLVSYWRKSANFNRPSLRITPSSSMQGLSVINWLFFVIGFPELKASYSSQKASRCAKRTISSSASFIPSGNSSILAFLLSLLRMLCSTLLTLAYTRTKRVQLEYRFGSSLHTASVLFCFGVVSFWSYTSWGLHRHSCPLSSSKLLSLAFY